MPHPLPQIKSAIPIAGYTLHIVFADNTEKIIDLEPILHGPLYGPLRNPKLFREVSVDPEIQTIVWPNGADFDPATLLAWDTVKNELAERARNWKAD